MTKTPVLTAKARIPQNDPNFVRAEATASGVVFHFSATPAVDLQVGNVVAGGDGKGNTYLREITKVVSRSDKRIEVKTTSAYITDRREQPLRVLAREGEGVGVTDPGRRQLDQDLTLLGPSSSTSSTTSGCFASCATAALTFMPATS